jgi:hypothetical protein
MRETVCFSSFRRYSPSPAAAEVSPLPFVHSSPQSSILSKNQQEAKPSPGPGVFCYYSDSDSNDEREKESEPCEPFPEDNHSQQIDQPEVEVFTKRSRTLESEHSAQPAYFPSSLSEIFEVAGVPTPSSEAKVEFNAFDHRLLDIRFLLPPLLALLSVYLCRSLSVSLLTLPFLSSPLLHLPTANKSHPFNSTKTPKHILSPIFKQRSVNKRSSS